MADPNFSKSVTYLCAHNEDGAMGIVINRPMPIDLGEVFEQMEITSEGGNANTQAIYQGGPVHQDRGFIIHCPAQNWDSTICVTDTLALTTSRDILEAMSVDKGPDKSLVALGYAGWGAGQLEQEMAQNAWLSGPADPDIIFDVPATERWKRAADSMGISISALSSDIGHA